MTSKISFFRLIKEDLKRRGWLVALTCLALLVALPVDLILTMDNRTNQVKDGFLTLEDARNTYLGMTCFGDTIQLLAILGAIAAVAGLSGFSYIHSREKLDFFYSLPPKRKQWFWVQYAAGVLVCAVPYLFCVLFFSLIGQASGVAKSGDLRLLLEAYIVHMIYYLLFYSIAILAAVLTGRLVVSALMIPAIVGLGPACSLLALALSSAFFDTYGGVSMEKWWWTLSPIGLTWRVEEGMAGFLNGGIFPGFRMLRLIALTALLILAGRVLFSVRRTETAGSSLAFHWLEAPLKVLVSVPGAVASALAIYSLIYSNSDFWLYGSAVFCGIFFCCAMEFIYHTDIREIFRAKGALFLTLGISVAVISVFRFDLTGYDSYLPEKEKIVQMAVYQSGLDYRSDYTDGELSWGDIVSSLDYSLTENFDPIYTMAQNGVANAKTENPNGVRVTIEYQLKNGRTRYRCYYLDSEVYAQAEDELFADKAYLEKLYAIYQAPEEGYTALSLNTLDGDSNTVALTKSQQEAFFRAYKEELHNVSYSDIAGDELIAQVSLYYTSGDIQTYDDQYPILKSFTKTLAVLEELGLTISEKLDASEISSVEIYEVLTSEIYNDSVNGSYITQTFNQSRLFTDEDAVAAIVNSLSYADSTSVSWNRYVISETQNYYSIYISFKENQQFVSFYLGKDKLPESIAASLEES